MAIATKRCLLIWALHKSKTFSKHLMQRFVPRGPKLPKIEFFHRIFSVIIFFTINQYHALPYTVGKSY